MAKAYCPECRARTALRGGKCSVCFPFKEPEGGDTDTLDLFSLPNVAAARSADPETSRAAAEWMRSGGRVGSMESAVLEAIAALGAATWDDITSYTGARAGAVSPRFKPLRERGLIQADGERRGESGRNQTVWVLTRAGAEYLNRKGAA